MKVIDDASSAARDVNFLTLLWQVAVSLIFPRDYIGCRFCCSSWKRILTSLSIISSGNPCNVRKSCRFGLRVNKFRLESQ